MKKRYWELDLLRLFAAGYVVALHYLMRGFAPGDALSPFHFHEIGPYFRYGYLAVNLFFVISGFVILMSVSGTQEGLGGLRRFAKSRFLRLYPAYWVACTTTFIVVRVLAPEIRDNSVARYALNMTMLNGFFGVGDIDGVYWTLFVEMRFYILVGLVVYFGCLPRFPAVLVGLLVISALNFWLRSGWLEYLFFTKHAPYFVAGCFFYLVKVNGMNRRLAFCAILASFLTGLAWDVEDAASRAAHYGLPFENWVLVAHTLAFGAFFSLVGVFKSPLPPALLNVAGGMSYPLYLLHAYIGYSLLNRLPHTMRPSVAIILVVCSMLVASYIMYRYLEPAVKRRTEIALAAIGNRLNFARSRSSRAGFEQ